MHLKRVILQTDRYPTDEHYPFNLDIFRRTEAIEPAAVTIFVGDNGSGKSTLLEALARRCGIHIWDGVPMHRVQRNPYEKLLARYLQVQWAGAPVPGGYFSAQTFRHFSRLLDEFASADPGQLKHFGGKSLMTQSHGQSLMAYFSSRYRVRGLYLLDEPETALTPQHQLELVRIIRAMARDGHAQFILATHSPILLACPGAKLLNFDAAPLAPIAYTRTAHYRIYKAFMEDPGAHFEP